MKKHISIALAVVLILMPVLSVPAFAEEDATGSFAVTYNVQSSYVVNLPDIACEDGENIVNITADYVHLEAGKRLTVSIDKSRTLRNGRFYLFKDGGTDLNTAMECSIYVSNTNSSNNRIYAPYWFMDNPSLTTVAVFYAEQTEPEAYGKMTFTPQVTVSTPYGAYTGNVYYIISID